MKRTWLALVLALPPACYQQPAGPKTLDAPGPGTAALDTLLERMVQRLGLMDQVARIKWN